MNNQEHNNQEEEEVKKYDSAAYYKNFKEKHHDKIYTKIECPCGGLYSYYSKSKHYKTKKHCYYVKHGVQLTKMSRAESRKRYQEKIKNMKFMDIV